MPQKFSIINSEALDQAPWANSFSSALGSPSVCFWEQMGVFCPVSIAMSRAYREKASFLVSDCQLWNPAQWDHTLPSPLHQGYSPVLVFSLCSPGFTWLRVTLVWFFMYRESTANWWATMILLGLLKELISQLINLAAPGLSHDRCNLVPRSGMEPGPPALGVQSFSHWTTREVPWSWFFQDDYLPVGHQIGCIGVRIRHPICAKQADPLHRNILLRGWGLRWAIRGGLVLWTTQGGLLLAALE